MPRAMSASIVIVLLLALSGVRACVPDADGKVDFSGIFPDTVITSQKFISCLQNVNNITELDISMNNISSISNDSFFMFYNLQRLNLSNNNIQTLNTGVFLNLWNLQELDLSFNKLERLQAGLIDVVKLQSVWFNNNNISEVEPGIVGSATVSLVYFNLNNNSLTYLDPWPYITHQTHNRGTDRVFYVQHNNIQALTNYMNWTHNLVYPFEVILNAQFNSIKTAGLETIRQYMPNATDDALFPLLLTLYLNITNNDFFCDCKMHDLVKTVRGGIFRYSRVEEFRYRCESPPHLKGWDFLHDLPLRSLVCNHTVDCPVGCSCQERPDNDTLFIDCRGQGLREMPDTIPTTKRSKVEMFLDGNLITQVKNTSYFHLLHNISLRNNLVDRLDERVLSALQANKVDLRNNRIKTLPKEVQKFDSIQLSGNPLECDCGSLWMRQWFEVDTDNADSTLTCTAKTGMQNVLQMTERSLGCTNELLIILGIMLVVILAIIISVLIFAKRCPYETKVMLFKYLRLHFWDRHSVDKVESKDVDIYLVFDEKDTDVVGYIRYFVHVLNKKKPTYSILNPQRFMFADTAQDNIYTLMEKSKRVIVFLSNGIFKNGDRMSEINDAERRQVEEVTQQPQDETDDADGRKSRVSTVQIELENMDNHAGRQNPAENTHQQNNNAPRIIYVVYNKDPNLAMTLEQEPWKTRLADKTVLRPDPDDKWFWAKMRYELPLKGRGVGDGNYMPFRSARVAPEERPATPLNPKAVRHKEKKRSQLGQTMNNLVDRDNPVRVLNMTRKNDRSRIQVHNISSLLHVRR